MWLKFLLCLGVGSKAALYSPPPPDFLVSEPSFLVLQGRFRGCTASAAAVWARVLLRSARDRFKPSLETLWSLLSPSGLRFELHGHTSNYSCRGLDDISTQSQLLQSTRSDRFGLPQWPLSQWVFYHKKSVWITSVTYLGISLRVKLCLSLNPSCYQFYWGIVSISKYII